MQHTNLARSRLLSSLSCIHSTNGFTFEVLTMTRRLSHLILCHSPHELLPNRHIRGFKNAPSLFLRANISNGVTQQTLSLHRSLLLTHPLTRDLGGRRFSRPFSLSSVKADKRQDKDRADVKAQPSEDDLEGIAQDVLEATYKHDVMAASLPLQSVVQLLSELSQMGVPLLVAARLLSGRLWLLKQPDTLISILDTVAQHGLPLSVGVSLLKSAPAAHTTEGRSLDDFPHAINESCLQFRALGFTESQLEGMMSRDPLVLLTPAKTLRLVFAKLKGLFTSFDAMRVAETCTVVITQPWKETNKIFDYAFFTMGYTQSQIVKSEVLTCDLNKLQDRHVFLMRAGMFTRPKPKEQGRLNTNPSLRLIVSLPDSHFGLEFGGLAEEEFRAFLDMREAEREAHRDIYDGEERGYSSDSDSDEERRTR